MRPVPPPSELARLRREDDERREEDRQRAERKKAEAEAIQAARTRWLRENPPREIAGLMPGMRPRQ